MKGKAERIAYWDNLKFFMILLVVIGHFVLVYYNQSQAFKSIHLFIYAFHMPVLFFVSGFFFHEAKAKKLCLFYISCGVLLKIGFSICDFLLMNPVSFWLLYEGDIPWFMFSLGYFCLILPLINTLDSRFVLFVSLLLSCSIGYDSSNADFLVLFRTIVFFPFFYLGNLCKRNEERIVGAVLKYTQLLKPVSFVVLLIWCILCFRKSAFISEYLHVFKGRFKYSEAIIRYGMLARLGCYLLAVATGLSVMVLCPRRRIPWLTDMGAKTINVYFWHWIIYKMLSKMQAFHALLQLGPSGKIIYLCISVVLCCVIASIRLFDWPLKQVRHMILSS